MNYKTHKFLSDINFILAIVTLVISLYYFVISDMIFSLWFLVYTIFLAMNGYGQSENYLRIKKRGCK